MQQWIFSDLDQNQFKVFANKLALLYPAITQISVYMCAWPEAKYCLVVKLGKANEQEYQRAINVFSLPLPWQFREIAGTPEAILLYEDDWLVWEGDPSGVVIEDTGFVLYENKIKDPIAFLEGLKVEVESDSELKIKAPGKQPKYYRCTDMGFKNERTEAWRLLIKTLRSDLPVISLPSRYKNNEPSKDYERKRGQLREINKKLVSFFNKEFRLHLSTEDLKKIKLYKSNNDRTFYFIFKAPHGKVLSSYDKYNGMPQDELLREIDRLTTEYTKSQGDSIDIVGQLTVAWKTAKKKNWISLEKEKQIEKTIRDGSDKSYLPEDTNLDIYSNPPV